MIYRDKLYSAYVSTHTSHFYGKPSIEEIRRQFPVWESYFGKFLAVNKNSTILDIGCGNGGFVYFLQNYGFKKTIGIDISKEQVDLAKTLNIGNVMQNDVFFFLSGKEESFDIIFAIDFMEHFNKEEVLEMLNTVYKALKVGGVLIVQVPNAESPFSGRIMYGDFTHELFFTQHSLSQLFLATNYKMVECYPTGPIPKGFRSVIRCFLWKGIEAVLRFCQLIETGSKDGLFTQNIIATARK